MTLIVIRGDLALFFVYRLQTDRKTEKKEIDMILKVRTADGSWKYYEGFYDINIKKDWVQKPEAVTCDEGHIVGPKGMNAGARGSGEKNTSKNPEYVMYYATLGYPSGKMIAFDTEAYLLNYEGKTIERMN